MLKSLKTKIIAFVTLVLTTNAAGIVYSTHRDVGQAMLAAEESAAMNVLQLVELHMHGGYNRLLSDKLEILSQLRFELKEISQLSASVFRKFFAVADQSGLTEEQARSSALEWLESVGFRGDVFVFGRDGKVIGHSNPSFQNLSFESARDLKGRPLASLMDYERLDPTGDGAVFAWNREGDPGARKNMGYFVPLEEWQLTLAASIDFDDIEAESQRKMDAIVKGLQKTFGKLQVARTGYALLFSGDNEVLVAPSAQGFSRVLTPDVLASSAPLLAQLKNAYNSGQRQLQYSDPFSDDARAVKAFMAYFRAFDWYLAVVVPLEEIKAPAESLVQRQSLITTLIFLGSILAAFVLVAKISRPLNLLTSYAKQLPSQDFTSNEPIDHDIYRLPTKYQDEVGRLAESFVFMEAELKKNVRNAIELTAAKDKEHFEKMAAEKADRAKSEFLANTSHELRTPIHGMLGITEMLLKTKLDDSQRHFARTIHGSGKGLLNIINDILDFSKMEAGKLRLETTDFRIADLVEGIGDQFAEGAHRKGLELVCRVCDECGTTYRGDSNRLHQVLVNLCGNAIKFTDEGEVVVEVSHLGSSEGHALLRFTVTDTGVGVDPAIQKHIFDSFAQADGSMTRRYGGTGLGLAVSKQLAELMGGEIGFESAQGEGSTFWFTTLLEPVADKGPRTEEPEQLLERRVLLADDNESSRRTLTQVLEGWGVLVDAVEDGRGAALRVREAAAGGVAYDVALVDDSLVDSCARELSRDCEPGSAQGALRTVVLRSVVCEGDLATGLASFDGSIMKPVKRDALRRCLLNSTETGASDECGASSAVPDAPPNFGATVLVAEDNRVNQDLVATMLQYFGCSMAVVDNGREALAALERSSFDLVLMDCQMPVMDGFEAARAIRDRGHVGADGRHLPVIAMTASAMYSDRAKCLNAGMDDYLSKPFDSDELAGIMGKWLPASPEEPAAAVAPDHLPTSPAVTLVSAADEQLLDAAVLEKIRTLGRKVGRNTLGELVEIYVQDSVAMLDDLRGAVERSDADGIRQGAHALKSSSANLGARTLAALLKELEQMGKDGSTGGAAEALGRVEPLHRLVCEHLVREAQTEDGASAVA